MALKCISPTLVRLKDSNHLYAVPCGRCYACMEKKRTELSLRLHYDLSVAYESAFITLTYSDDNLPENGIDYKTGELKPLPSVDKLELQRFFKRVRKYMHYDNNVSLKYYASAEYGDGYKRPHYHSILYTMPADYDNDNTDIVIDKNVPSYNVKHCLRDAVFHSWTKHNLMEIPESRIFESIHSPGALKYVAKHQVKRCQGLDEQAPILL